LLFKFSRWFDLFLLLLAFEGTYQGQEIVKFSASDGKRIYSNTEEIYRLIPGAVTLKTPRLAPLNEKSDTPLEIEKLIREISEQHGIDPELVKAVVKTESNFNPRAISHKGAHGLMQLVPDTAKRFGVANVWDPKQNIEGGVKFLKFLMSMFPDNLPYVLAAYNSGENAVLKYRGVPPYPETQAYVRKITQTYNKKGNLLIASNQTEPIVSHRDNSGRVVYSNLDGTYR
jgi:soluble lytic murein transglycosylase-like protein